MGPCSRSVLITFTVRVTKQRLVNINFLKKTSTAHYRGTIGLVVLESKYNIGTSVLSQNKISVLVRVLAHWCFNSYAPELVPIFYSAITHRYQCFIS